LADQFDYELYARWAIDVGLPYESKTIIAEGQRAGKIPAGSAESKQILALASSSIANDGTIAQLETRGRAGTGRLALAAADANLGSDNYVKAIELYRLALQKGGVDANAVNLRLGIALARSGDKEGAKAAFAASTTWPMSGVGMLWTTFLDNPPAA
jgi:Flp pilus assembly protein TadD